jgi:hypothetical protein
MEGIMPDTKTAPAYTRGTRRVWQIGSGPDGREFKDTLLDNDVALLGPGDVLGEWDVAVYRKKASKRNWGPLRMFYEEVRDGDLALMRTGKKKIMAIGLFIGDRPEFNDLFGDVSGWDLQHVRRVLWSPFANPIIVDDNTFGARPTRFNEVHTEFLIELAEKEYAKVATDLEARTPRALDVASPTMEPAELRDYLRNLAEYYARVYELETEVSEHEVVCHTVVPLLRTLGWFDSQIALEWSPGSRKRVDVAVFGTASRRAAGPPEILIEVKRPDQPFEAAYRQACEYACGAGCKSFFLTDGFCWRKYSTCSEEPTARAKMIRFTADAQMLVDALRPRVSA